MEEDSKEKGSVRQAVDRLFRHEYGKMVAVLTRLLGLENLPVAQDIVQDTLLKAMTSWSYSGMPDNPAAWLYRVAKNKAIDHIRREKKFRQITPEYAGTVQTEYIIASAVHGLFLDTDIEDSQLRMMFACCHPAIPIESQIALTLKTLCGLNTLEIARAFLTNEETIQKRIYRAREKIRSEVIALEVPPPSEIVERTDAVLKCLYLLFNEGYNSSDTDQLIREDLCADAMRLGELITRHSLTSFPRSHALMALFCLQASRLHARLDDNGHIILMKYQDRSKWFRPLMEKGFAYLEKAAEPFEASTYHLEAAIAAIHARANTFDKTDWNSIHHFYQLLYNIQPNPIVAMNKAIAAGYASGRENALRELDTIKGLENHYLYHATIGEMNFDLGRLEKAKESFSRAWELTSSKSEKLLLEKRIGSCQ